MVEKNYNLLLNKLDEFIRKFYVNQIIRGGILFTGIALVIFLFAAIAEYIGQFNTTVRTVFFYTSIGLLGVLFSYFILKPLLKLVAIGKRISHKKAAEIIGVHFSAVDDKLINVLELKYLDDDSSSDLIKASINQKIRELQPIPFSIAINFKENKRYLKYMLIPSLIVLILAAFEPKILTDSTNRLIDYSSSFVPQAPYQIKVENEDLTAYKNEDFKLLISIQGDEIPASMNIIYAGERYLMKKQEKRQFSYQFKNVQESTTFSFYDGQFSSSQYRLKLLPKPLLMDISIDLTYPPYLNKQTNTVENTGDLVVPEGTQIKWVFKTENVDKLHFIGNDSSKLLLQSGEDEFIHSDRFFESVKYGLSTANNHLKFADTAFYDLTVIPDLKPNIEVEVKKVSNNLQTLFFKGLIKDDYGFSNLYFYHRHIGADDSLGESVKTAIPFDASVSQTIFYHAWQTKQLSLKPGDQIEYYFEVWDNDGVNGSKSSRTAKMFLKAPSKEDLKTKDGENSEQVKNSLKESIELTEEIRNDLESLKEKMLNKKKFGYQEKKQLEELLKKQKKMKENLKKMGQQNKENNQLQNEYNPLEEELVEKQNRLQELFEKVMDDEMKEMMKEIEKMMDQLKKDQLQKSMEKMELSNDELMKELDRNMELFKQLEVEKELSDAKKQLDEIKEKQKKLKEESHDKNANAEEIKEKQDQLNEEFDQLSEKIEEMHKKNQDLEYPNELEKTDNLEDEIKKDMSKSSEELSKMNKKKASEKQGESEQKMEQLSEKLSAMQMKMQSQQNAENLEDLRAILENLIQLSFDQEEVMKKIKNTSQNDPQYVQLSQRQKKLKDDSKIIEDSLFALSKRVAQLESIINEEIGKVNYNMDKAIEELQERRTATANSRQQLSMTSINNLALLLDEAIQKMQAQMQMMSSGNKSCKKPGNGKPSPGGMKNLQQSLNQQMQRLKKSLEEGKSPGKGKGKKPGKDGMPSGSGMSKQLAKMAAKQAAIREAVKEMQEQIGEGNKGSGGNLKKLQELMEETETELVNKQITNETILRQQEILSRLLESEKAEREREKDKKRESVEFTDELSRNQKIFLEYNRAKEKELELLKSIPPSFNQFYKTKVTEYFNQLKK